MRPLAALVLLALAASLSACDTTEPEEAEPLPEEAEVTVGAVYAADDEAAYGGSVLAFRDADTDEVTFDFLAHGATIAVEFTSADRFEASLFVPYEALVASGETDDLDGDVRQAITGSYRQVDGALTFTFDTWVDSFFSDRGWAIDADGGAIRYQNAEDEVVLDVVLSRG